MNTKVEKGKKIQMNFIAIRISILRRNKKNTELGKQVKTSL